MNIGQLNGFNLNSTAQGGNNAVLSEGITSSSVFTALLLASAILTGGFYSEPTSGGRVSQTLIGGSYTNSVLGGTQFRTANLQQGISVNSSVGSNLGIASGLNGGNYSGSGYGGQVKTHIKLQTADTVGDTSVISGLIRFGSGLNAGVFSNSWLTSQIIGSTVLVAGGLSSTSVLDSTLNTGRILSEGADSFNELNGDLKLTLLFQGGVSSNTVLGQSLSINPKLQDGIVQVGVVGSPVMLINAHLNDGIGSNTLFMAQAKLSPNSNYGVDTNSFIDAKMRKYAVLSGGFSSLSLVDSIALKATQKLPGGITSTDVLTAGYIIGSHLDLGIASNTSLNGDLRLGIQLISGIENTSEITGQLVLNTLLQGHISSDSTIDSTLLTHQMFQNGLVATSLFDAGLSSSPHLNDGHTSDSIVSGYQCISVVLHDGTSSNETILSNLLADTKLQGSLFSTSETNSLVLLTNQRLQKGVESTSFVDAALVLSPHLNNGVICVDSLSSNYCLFAILQEGIRSTSFTNSVFTITTELQGAIFSTSQTNSPALLISQRLQEGMASISFVDATLLSSPILADGVSSFSQFLGKQHISAKLQSGVATSNDVDTAVLFITTQLQGGVYSYCQGDGFVDIDCQLKGGILQDSLTTANLQVNSRLYNGVASNQEVGGTIVQSFMDPLLNTWALSIISATQILSIETPNQDI